MPVYTESKGLPTDADGNAGQTYHENATSTPWRRLEPLLTPEQLVSRFLVGIPLVSRIKDPLTGKPQRITPDMLRDYIEVAVDEIETELSLDIMPVKYHEKPPYQKQDFEQFGFCMLKHKPVATIDRFTVQLADNSEIFVFPTEWIETANLTYGQFNLIPLAFQSVGAGQGIINPTGGGTAVFFNSLWNRPWVAALFGVDYTTGFKDGMVPKVVNELIGCCVAMKVLSMLGATYARSNSASLGIDGMSQSISTPGPNVFSVRIGELKELRAMLVKKLKKMFGQKIIMGNV